MKKAFRRMKNIIKYKLFILFFYKDISFVKDILNSEYNRVFKEFEKEISDLKFQITYPYRNVIKDRNPYIKLIDGTEVILDWECKAKCYNPRSCKNEVIPDGVYDIDVTKYDAYGFLEIKDGEWALTNKK